MLVGKSSLGRCHKSLKVTVAGDKGTGKSRLISAVAFETFPYNIPRVLPSITLPADAYLDYIPITIVDTLSRFGVFRLGTARDRSRERRRLRRQRRWRFYRISFRVHRIGPRRRRRSRIRPG